MGYYPGCIEILTHSPKSGWETVSGGQFDWGGGLAKGNGGVERFPQIVEKSILECKGKRKNNSETNKARRDESRS